MLVHHTAFGKHWRSTRGKPDRPGLPSTEATADSLGHIPPRPALSWVFLFLLEKKGKWGWFMTLLSSFFFISFTTLHSSLHAVRPRAWRGSPLCALLTLLVEERAHGAPGVTWASGGFLCKSFCVDSPLTETPPDGAKFRDQSKVFMGLTQPFSTTGDSGPRGRLPISADAFGGPCLGPQGWGCYWHLVG